MSLEETSQQRPSLTKIVATLGPATDDPALLRRLIENGVSVVRLNLSHGTFQEHDARVDEVRRLERDLDQPIAILGDLPGPKLRVGEIPGEGLELRTGQDVIFSPEIDVAEPGETPRVPVTYRELAREALPGHRVLLNDGAIRALAVEAMGSELRCRVTAGGLLSTGKGLNLPDSDLSAPAITEYDWKCVEWAVERDLDYLALSFVRRGEEVAALTERLVAICADGECGPVLSGRETRPRLPVIAKIEKPQAVERIDEILTEADGVMVARGDLGVEMDLALVPVTQKRLILRAQAHGKPCIVATEMLQSMINSPTATRAEVSDVANAIFDASDAVMLSGETAVGKHGALAVDLMRRVALATEGRLREMRNEASPAAEVIHSRSRSSALAHGAWHIARDVEAMIVACWSQHGGTARSLSRVGFRVPVVAFSSNLHAVRRMSLLYGVTPVHEPNPPEHRHEFAQRVEDYLVHRGLARQGDQIVILAGKPLGSAGATDSVSVLTIGLGRP